MPDWALLALAGIIGATNGAHICFYFKDRKKRR